MKEEIRDKIQDKTLPQHNYITLELVRRKFLKCDDFELYIYDSLFEELLTQYDFKLIIVSVSYTISCIKRNKFKDEDGKPIECLYAYFRKSLFYNLKKLTTPVYIDWMDDS